MVSHVSRSRPTYKPADDYYTPPELFEQMAITFDIDVCAPKGGVPWIPAARHYSIEDDGLVQPWTGRVWMNPPFSKPAPWIKRFTEHKNGICLTQLSRSEGLRNLWMLADGIVLAKDGALQKSQFIYQGRKKNVFMPVALFAFGNECTEAIAKFGRLR